MSTFFAFNSISKPLYHILALSVNFNSIILIKLFCLTQVLLYIPFCSHLFIEENSLYSRLTILTIGFFCLYLNNFLYTIVDEDVEPPRQRPKPTTTTTTTTTTPMPATTISMTNICKLLKFRKIKRYISFSLHEFYINGSTPLCAP